MTDLESRLTAAMRAPTKALSAGERFHLDSLRVPADLDALYAKADREARVAIRRVESMRACAHAWPDEPWRLVPTMREVRKLSSVGPKAYRSLAGLIMRTEREREPEYVYQREDGGWSAGMNAPPGMHAHGATREEAIATWREGLADAHTHAATVLRSEADALEQGE